MKYRIPYKLLSCTAKNKAKVAYYQRLIGANSYEVLPQPGASVVEFEASSQKNAERELHKRILPGDGRNIMARSMVKWFQIGA
jgi:hypothetical protein